MPSPKRELTDTEREYLRELFNCAIELRPSLLTYEKLMRSMGHPSIAVSIAGKIDRLDNALAGAQEVMPL